MLRKELRDKIKDFNRKAEQAKVDGFTVMLGKVYRTDDLDPFSPTAKPVCAVSEYGRAE
jgi:hypothetical protein